MLHKKVYLERLIEEGRIRNFSIAGKPSKEIQEAYVKGQGFTHVFKKYGIESELNQFESSLIAIYIPDWYENGKKKVLIETCLVNFSLKEGILEMDNPIEEMNKVIEYLLDEVYDFYQINLTPVHFQKVIGVSDEDYGKKLTFKDMLTLIPDKQIDLAEKLKINRGTISDYKAERGTPSLKVISKLMNLFPLLPWTEYIKGVSKNGC